MEREIEIVNYRPDLVSLKEELEYYLGLSMNLDFVLKENGKVMVRADTPAGRNFGSVISQLLNGSPDESQRIKLRLLYFVKHLKELAELKPSALEKFRSRLRSTGDDVANFYGTMFEVEIGASLARKGLSFEEGERPDFEVEFSEETVGIECTIGRIEGGRTSPQKDRGKNTEER